MFFLSPRPLTLTSNYCSIHYLCQVDVLSLGWGGAQNFLPKPKGDQNFSLYAKGGQELFLHNFQSKKDLD